VDIQFSIRYKLAGDEISQGMKMLYYQMILSRNRSSVGFSVKVPQKFDVIRNLSRYGGRPILARSICTNGPAIWGGCVTRRKHRVESWYFSHKAVTVQGGYGTCFCGHGTIFIACWRDRGTILIGVANLSPVTKLAEGTGAVSRYKLSRNLKSVTVQDFNSVQMSVSGCNNHYKLVLSAGAKAKTVTNNLPILSVLGNVVF
jgi:hypothetical protein